MIFQYVQDSCRGNHLESVHGGITNLLFLQIIYLFKYKKKKKNN